MIDIIINRPEGDGVHTFWRRPLKGIPYNSLADFWARHVANVQGYSMNPDTPKPKSMTSQYRADWIIQMLADYPDDCMKAAQQLAVFYGLADLKGLTKNIKQEVTDEGSD